MSSEQISRKKRLKIVIDRINQILQDNNMVSLPRAEYENPKNQSSYNYGYMTSADFGSGNKESL